MNGMMAAYDRLTERFVAWADGDENVRAAVVIGSRARTDHPADEWSDLDILLYARDAERYRGNTDWYSPIGASWLSFEEPTPDGTFFERRVMFAGGLDVDLVPQPVDHLRHMAEHGIPSGAADLFARGVRVLVDKDGLLERILDTGVATPAYSPPTETDFLNSANDFWYHTIWTAKHLRRGELWWAKSCCDGYLKNLLHRMLEWHARASKGAATDTWLRGRFLEEWADGRAVDALSDVFAHYDADDVWRALFATMELYRWLSTETADLLGYGYPTDGSEHASRFVRTLFEERAS